MDGSAANRTSKVVTLEQAASLVKDGMKLAVGGQHINNAPNALVRAIVKRGVKELTIIPNNCAGYQVDILIGAGCIKKLYSSYVGMDYIGVAPNFRRLAESGKLNVIDLEELGILRALRAGAVGAAFWALPDGIMACENVKLNPDWYKVIDDPFTGKKVVVVPPLRSDVCIIHTARCDAYGNARDEGFVEGILHTAADKVIVTTDKLVPLEDTRAHYKEVTIPSHLVDAVVEVPWGAHPGGSHGASYQQDEEHLREYQKAGKEEGTFKEYLDRYVYGCQSHAEYLERIGGVTKLLKLRCY